MSCGCREPIRPGFATSRYSWMRPPRTSVRRRCSSVDVADGARSRLGLGRCALTQGPVRTVPVVVLDVPAEDGFEVTPSKDEHPVEALSRGGAHEPLADGVRP